MKPRYDELSLPISITITDRERIFRWGRTHRSHERFTRPKWDPSLRYPSSADCTTATNDGLPERARIKPCRYWLSDFLVRRVLAHRCTSQRIWFTRFKQGPQAHRPLRLVWKNNFDPWALRIFGRHSIAAGGKPGTTSGHKSFASKTMHKALTNPYFGLYVHPKFGSPKSCCAQANIYLRCRRGTYGSESGFQVV